MRIGSSVNDTDDADWWEGWKFVKSKGEQGLEWVRKSWTMFGGRGDEEEVPGKRRGTDWTQREMEVWKRRERRARSNFQEPEGRDGRKERGVRKRWRRRRPWRGAVNNLWLFPLPAFPWRLICLKISDCGAWLSSPSANDSASISLELRWDHSTCQPAGPQVEAVLRLKLQMNSQNRLFLLHFTDPLCCQKEERLHWKVELSGLIYRWWICLRPKNSPSSPVFGLTFLVDKGKIYLLFCKVARLSFFTF